MRKNWVSLASLALNVVLLAAVLFQGSRLNALETAVGNASGQIDSRLMQMQNQIVSSVSDVLEEQEQPIAGFTLEPTGLDAAARALTADAVLQLRERQPDAAVELTVSTAAGEDTQTRTADENGVCRIPVRIPAEGTGEIRMAAIVTAGGAAVQQDLGGWESIELLLPVQYAGGGIGYSFDAHSGRTDLGGCDVYLEDLKGEPAEVRDPVFRLLCSGETVQEQPGRLTEEGGSPRYTCGDWQDHPLQAGDLLEITFTCTDDFGLTYTFTVAAYQVAEDGSLAADAATALPTLTWPEDA